MKITFIDCDRSFIDAIRSLREKAPGLASKYGLKAVHKNIEDTSSLKNTAFISAANSFITMGGGVDSVYNTTMFPNIRKRIRKRLKIISDRTINYPTENGVPYLPVGSALVTPLDKYKDWKSCYIVSAPTMYKPSDVSDKPYACWAFLAALQAVHECEWADNIKRIVCTGMCTGVGGMPAQVSAAQMMNALQQYDNGTRIVDCSPIKSIVLHEYPKSNQVTRPRSLSFSTSPVPVTSPVSSLTSPLGSSRSSLTSPVSSPKDETNDKTNDKSTEGNAVEEAAEA